MGYGIGLADSTDSSTHFIREGFPKILLTLLGH